MKLNHSDRDSFLKDNFKIFLADELDLSTKAPNSDFSTVQDYVYRVDRARKKENMDWYTLAQNIDDVVMRYSSAIESKDKSLTRGLKAYQSFIQTPILDDYYPEQLGLTPIEFFEGKKTKICYNRYERNRAARKACIEAHGSTCSICGFDFARIYGDDFKGIIHVHHTIALAGRGGKESRTDVDTLIPVCPNCHVVLHAKKGRNEVFKPQEIIAYIEANKQNH